MTAINIMALRHCACWTPDPAITREACDNLLDLFLFSGLICRRHAFESCVSAPPDLGL